MSRSSSQEKCLDHLPDFKNRTYQANRKAYRLTKIQHSKIRVITGMSQGPSKRDLRSILQQKQAAQAAARSRAKAHLLRHPVCQALCCAPATAFGGGKCAAEACWSPIYIYYSMLPDVLALQYIRFCNLSIDSEISRHVVTTERKVQSHTRL